MSIPMFQNPIVFHYLLYVISMFFLIPLFYILLFQKTAGYCRICNIGKSAQLVYIRKDEGATISDAEEILS